MYNRTMKVSGAFLLVLLFALAIVLMLRVKEIEHIEDDIQTMVPHLMEAGVEAKVMSHREALARIDELSDYCLDPDEIRGHVTRLREIAAEAASWAAGAPSPSAELTTAVAIRGAAQSLREYASQGSNRALEQAKSQLGEARSALEGDTPASSSATHALRDRVRNIRQSHQEKLQDLEEAQ